MTHSALLDALREAVAFEPSSERVGNLTIGRGTLDGRIVHVALIENYIASGSLGQTECEHLGALFEHMVHDKAPMVMYIDSAGARVSEGLRALGGFRRLYRAGLVAALRGAPIAAVLGRNCYGGASMLAHLAQRRLFSPDTSLAMSGPAVIAAASGLDPTDEAFRAMASATFSPAARATATGDNTAWSAGDDVAAWLRHSLNAPAAHAFEARHGALQARLPRGPAQPAQAIFRDELERIYTSYDARETEGVIEGEGEREDAREAFLGIMDNRPVDTARAWRLSDAAWRHAARPPARLEVFLDSASHAARLDEERRVLSEFIVDMGAALASLAAKGTRVRLTVTGRAGGGVYVALAAPAQRVASVYARARIEVLPGLAVAAILGETRDEAPGFAEYRAAGVADEELKLGFLSA